MNLREYQQIVTIAQERNITRAAEKLYISQPALSKMLTTTEKALGALLFERTGRSLSLTPVGKVFVEHARRMLRLQSQMTNKIQHEIRRQNGPYLQVGVMLLHMDFFVCTIVPAFHRQYPQSFVSVDIIGSGHAVERVSRGDFALALAVLGEGTHEQVNTLPIGQQEYVLVVPKGHPLLMKAVSLPGYTHPCIDADSIADSRYLLVNPRSHSGQWADAYFEQHNITPYYVTQVMSPAIAYRAVAQGEGVCILPSLPRVVHGLGDAIAYLSLAGNTRVDTLSLLYDKSHTLTDEEMSMVNIVRAHYQTETP